MTKAATVLLSEGHFDPSHIPLETLAKIRGAMWPSRLNLPYGPRPGQDDNILAMDFYGLYGKNDRKRMVANYGPKSKRKYTHAVAGPCSGTDCYHNKYPCHDTSNPGSIPIDAAPSQTQWNYYLDMLQELWDAHIASINFIHPDGWTFEQTRDIFTPLLQQPRAQKLIKLVVPGGWEPAGYDWSSYTWAMYFKWAREVLPNALVLMHNACKPDGSPYDAPVGTDANGDDNGRPNGEGWSRVAPYLHGWLIQNGPFNIAPWQNPNLAYNFGGQFSTKSDGQDTHGFAWHFKNGIGGWPTGSAWGPNTPIKLYNAECTSYEAFWNNLPEATSLAWGDLAITSGACGYLDGGTLTV